MILSLGWNSPNIKEILIINPDYQKVVKRVQLLLNDDKNNIDLVAYLPDDLETKINF
jgi:hypothetical protein